jgi:excisionase family DNA binding protein
MVSLIDAEVAARRLGVSTWRLHQLAREGIVPVVRLGRRVMIDPEALEAFIARGGRAFAGGWKREPANERTVEG